MLTHLKRKTPLLFGLLVLATAFVAGEYYRLYDRIDHIDKVFHVLGGLAVGWMAMALLQDDVKRLAGWKQLLIVTGITCLVGVLWEFAEYLSNFSRHTYPMLYHYFHGGNLTDTLGDLTADIIGSGLFVTWALIKERD